MIAALDIGGTWTKYAVLNHSGEFVPPFPKQLPTSKELLTSGLTGLILALQQEFPLDSVGISIAANVTGNGEVIHTTNLPLSPPIPLAGPLSEALALPVFLENDGNCAALAVSRFSGVPENAAFVVLTMGTGIGGGIICDGKLMVSETGAIAELGHITIDPAGPLCACGKHGCLEALIGESALVSRYNRIAGEPLSSTRELSIRMKKGDTAALSVAAFAGEQLGKGMAIISDVIAPRSFYVAGGVSGLGAPFLTAAEKSLSRECFLRLFNRVPSVELVAEAHLLSLKGAWVLAS